MPTTLCRLGQNQRPFRCQANDMRIFVTGWEFRGFPNQADEGSQLVNNNNIATLLATQTAAADDTVATPARFFYMLLLQSFIHVITQIRNTYRYIQVHTHIHIHRCSCNCCCDCCSFVDICPSIDQRRRNGDNFRRWKLSENHFTATVTRSHFAVFSICHSHKRVVGPYTLTKVCLSCCLLIRNQKVHCSLMDKKVSSCPASMWSIIWMPHWT